MNNILIIGAMSAMAEHCARLWAARGDVLFLVAPNEEHLETIATDLRVRGATNVVTCSMNLNEINDHQAMIDAAKAALGGIDTVLIAHGTVSNQKVYEKNVAEMLAEIQTSALSTIALLTLIANRFEARESGTIAVISSVAVDRGRASNYIYGGAKAMVTYFTSSLRQRLHKLKVAVVTIKPGFVDTPTTAVFKKGFLWAKPESVEAKIVSAIDQRRDKVYVLAFWWVIMTVIKRMPEWLKNECENNA